MTKKKNLTAFMIAIIVMLFSLPANAQGTVGYVEWDRVNTLTFKGGPSVPASAYPLNTDSNRPIWNSDSSLCTKVVFDESFKDVRPTSCCYWFEGFSKLSTIENIGYLNTDNVTNMHAMFAGCSKLTSLNLSKFNTAKVTHMTFMFNGCSGLTSLDLSSFNTAKVTWMYHMFAGCSKLTSLDLSNFNTAKVSRMYNMFYGCSGLTSLDLSSFNTATVTYMENMFDGCSGLTTIYVSDDFTTDKVSKNNSTGMFGGCIKLVGAVQYDSDQTDKDMANYKNGYFKTYYKLGENQVDLCGETLTTTSLDLSGDNDFVAHAPFTVNTVTYTRNLSSSTSTWFSLCLPFAYTPKNFTAYQLKGATEKAVEIEQITGAIAAGTPIIFKFKDDADKKINISVSNANIKNDPGMASTTENDCQLYGTYQEKTFSLQDGNTFIIYKDRLMNPATMLQKNVTKVGLKPFHAYMTMTSSASAKSFSIGSGDEGTTAIDLLNSVATDDAEYYDINGRRIDAPAKGVNIVRRGNKTMKLIIK